MIEEPDYVPFTYPSAEERKAIIKSQPLLDDLFFDPDTSDKFYTDFTEYKNAHDLKSWKNRFNNNKIRKLIFSYVLIRYCYERKIPDEIWLQNLDSGETVFLPYLTSEREKSNLFLFNYSSEHYYYHYISASDIVYHLLNVFYNLEVKENSRFNTTVSDKLTGKTAANLLSSFNNDIRSFRNERNGLTHNFPFNEIDARSREEIENGKRVYTIGVYNYVPSKEVLRRIDDSLKPLANLVKGLNEELK